MNMSRKTGAVALAIMMLGAGAALGQVQGTIITAATEFKGALKWKVSAKAYEVNDGTKTIEVPQVQVQEIKVPKPRALTDAEKQMAEGNYAAAIPALKKISADYLMLTWDRPATRLLAVALLATGDHEEGIRVCETVIKVDPPAGYLGELAPTYWQALLKSGGRNISKAEGLIAQAIKTGDRTASAYALNTRGNLILTAGDTPENAKKALKDGFLRVITLYSNERGPRPEALYMAAKCFEKIGQPPRADAFRTELKRDFPGTEWASKP
ncbi:MAG: tetratricopeptide repeat protein [Kiritimatiellaeota bacterium]|nr:tetratricopeptide repeat protein [Kiritimatiellota bacterium]